MIDEGSRQRTQFLHLFLPPSRLSLLVRWNDPLRPVFGSPLIEGVSQEAAGSFPAAERPWEPPLRPPWWCSSAPDAVG